jgi:hypothetical protein
MRTDRQIIEDLERVAKLKSGFQSDLSKFGKPGDKLRERVVFMSIRAAKGELDFFPHGVRASFATKAREAKKLSMKITKLAENSNFGVSRELLPVAEKLRAHGENLCKVKKKYGQPNHDEGLWVVVRNVLEVAPDFAHWEALARVVAEIYKLGGRGRGHITSDNVSRIAKELRQEQTEHPVRPVQELLARSERELQAKAEQEIRLLGIQGGRR